MYNVSVLKKLYCIYIVCDKTISIPSVHTQRDFIKVNVTSNRCACSGKRYHPHTRMSHGSLAPANVRACAMDRSRKLFRLFSRHISGTQSFRENRHISIHLLVVHNPLVPLIGRLVACSARTRADRQTDRQTDRTTTVTLAAHARRGLMRVETPTKPVSCSH